MERMLEGLQVDAGIVVNTTSSAIYTQSFSMKGYHEAAAVIQIGAFPTTGLTIEAAILGGDSTTAPASMSSLANAKIDIGTSSTSGLIKNAHAIRINIASSAAATISSAMTLNLGTSTFLTDSTASSTGGLFLTGVASVVAKSLTTLIQTWYPKYNTTYGATGGDTVVVDVELTDISATTTGIYCKATAQTTITGFCVQALKTVGVVSLPVAHLMATASSFTNFCVRVNTTHSSAIPLNVSILRRPVNSPAHIGAGHKRDLTTSALI